MNEDVLRELFYLLLVYFVRVSPVLLSLFVLFQPVSHEENVEMVIRTRSDDADYELDDEKMDLLDCIATDYRYKQSSFKVRIFAGRLRKRPSFVIATTSMVYSVSDLSIEARYSWSVPE